jgi:hypothetical protein
MPKPKPSVVISVFEDRLSAERALAELRRAGFDEEQVGLVMRDAKSPKPRRAAGRKPSKAEEGMTNGAIAGGLLGSVGAVGAVVAGLIPGVGPLLSVGLLASVLSGAAAGLAAGSVVGALVGLGVPEDEARHYESEVKAGRVLVTVRGGRRNGRAVALLRQAGGCDFDPEKAKKVYPAALEAAEPPAATRKLKPARRVLRSGVAPAAGLG